MKVLQQAINDSLNQNESLKAIILKNETHPDYTHYGYFIQVMSNGQECQASDTILKFSDGCKSVRL